jgi:cystathionine beta-lyase/cystathionine gamma-synthase
MKIMEDNKMLNYINDVLENMPTGWLSLTTHRLDIYDEKLAKTQFLGEFEVLFNDNNSESSALNKLHTAYDYIRLGHPLSCILEWGIANLNNLQSKNVISFSSKTVPVLAILRKNLIENKNTHIFYTGELPAFFDAEILRHVYGYKFDLEQIETENEIAATDCSTVFISQQDEIGTIGANPNIDFFINIHPQFGSILLVQGKQNESYISEIQHVRRRETIAMTPANCLAALNILLERPSFDTKENTLETDKTLVLNSIVGITGTTTKPLVASSGLSIQYAIMMGLVHDARENHKGKAIKFIVPPNCYGGTNDQARRVAACIDNVEVVDLPVDGDNDMVQSISIVLDKMAQEDAISYIIAEIPTNPRVEVPNLINLKNALSKVRKTATGEVAIDPVFILDQTFCPNVHFLGEDAILSAVRTISYI